MNEEQKTRMRAIVKRQRETHQKLFDLQGQMIDALKDALAAVSRTQDEMAKAFAADNEADDLLED